MKAPLSWLEDLVELPEGLSPEDIAQAFVNVGFEVESIDREGLELKGPLVVGRVLDIEELSGHKKPIRYVNLDCGEPTSRYVICGAQNFVVGDLVVVALPGALLPGGFSISSRETYGKISDGMICSAKELGMGEDHSGIIVLEPESTMVGADAIELLQLIDVIFDIAVNPDRGYAMSLRGLARELAGSLDTLFKDPAIIDETAFDAVISSESGVPAEIIDGASEIYLRTVEAVNVVAPTPLWMRRRIEKCGMRSISLPVDITNYVMLELGQPLHAFDADHITSKLVVRYATESEQLRTLDGQDRALQGDNLVIADSEKVLALAGTMGGELGEVNSATTRICIEAAHFMPLAIAKNARAHRLSTEASRRFERNVDPSLPEIASKRATDLLVEYAKAKPLGTSHDGKKTVERQVEVDLAKLNGILGRQYSIEEMKSMIDRIGARSTNLGNHFTVEVPTWRPDLMVVADFAEELARIHGYDLIPLRLPTGQPSLSQDGKMQIGESQSRRRRRVVVDYLAARGFAETQNYPFTSQEFIDQLGFQGVRARTFRIANPLSEEFPVLRTHLLQTLLPTAVRNLNRGTGNLALFEIGRIFRAPESVALTSILQTGSRPSDQEVSELFAAVPDQPIMVAGVIAGEFEKASWRNDGRSATWEDAVAMAADLVSLLGSEPTIASSDFAPWHPGRCAEVRAGDVVVAHAGELHPRVVEQLSLPPRSIAFALLLDLLPLAPIVKPGKLATMPPAIQDLALVVDEEVSAERVKAALISGAGELLERIELFDRYDQIAPGKISLAFTITLRASDRTLTSEEIAEIRNRAVAAAHAATGAILRS